MALEVEESLEALLGKGIPQVSRSRILNFKIDFDQKNKSFLVKLSTNVEITPQPCRWKTPYSAGCVPRSTPPLLSPVAPPWSDIVDILLKV